MEGKQGMNGGYNCLSFAGKGGLVWLDEGMMYLFCICKTE